MDAIALKKMKHFSEALSEDEKTELDDKALTTIELCISDDVLRFVANETTTVHSETSLRPCLWRRVHQTNS
jgi:hypothetical protein